MAAQPFDDRDGWVWMDGEFVPHRDAKIHVLTHALHYASAVFEGERAYGGVVFKGREHSSACPLQTVTGRSGRSTGGATSSSDVTAKATPATSNAVAPASATARPDSRGMSMSRSMSTSRDPSPPFSGGATT